MRLHGKVIVVTGGAGLLGKEHAKAILFEGGSVALLDVNIQELTHFYESLLPEFKTRTRVFHCDITNESILKEVCNTIVKELGVITGLVNNAAVNAMVEKDFSGFTRLEDFSVEQWTNELQVGLTGAMLCTKIFGKYMVQNQVRGSIVHIASDHGLIAPNQNLYKNESLDDMLQPVKPVSYSVVKHGLIGLSKYVATYWCDNGIRSNALCPGGVRNSQKAEFVEKFSKIVPLGRLAEPSEYRGALVFLLSDESSYMTGATLVIDGGRTAW